MDLHSRMERLGGSIDDPSATAIAGDLDRGRRAVRRRRAAQIATGSAFSVAAVATAFALTISGPGNSTPNPGLAGQVPPGVSQSAVTGGVQLVAYTGEKPGRFTIDQVPQGFFVQNQDEYELVLAPERAKSPGPGDDPASELFNPRVYTDKIAVFLEVTDFMVNPTGDEQFTIGDRPAALRTIPAEGDIAGATQIFVAQSEKVSLTVQFAHSTGLTKEQMITVAGGIGVDPTALSDAEEGARTPPTLKTGNN
ncbi:hypothetical protein JCM9533A_39070 [Catenuloplanes niger JCM 9533]